METTGVRFVRLLKMLIKVVVMLIVMIGLILISRKYMSDADGCERNGQKTTLEIVVAAESTNINN